MITLSNKFGKNNTRKEEKEMKKTLLSMGTVLMTASIMVAPTTTAYAEEAKNFINEREFEYQTDFDVPNAINDYTNLSMLEITKLSNEDAGIEPAWLFEKKYVVTGDNVNIRTGAGTNYPSVGKLYKGDIISVKSIDNGWAKFKYNDQWRYVSATYIKAN